MLTDLSQLPQKKRQKTLDRLAQIKPYLHVNCLELALKNHQGAVSKSTLRRWALAYKEKGIVGLIPQNKGRIVSTKPWKEAALKMFHHVNRMGMKTLARHLVQQGHACTYRQVKYFLDNLPAQLGNDGKARLGAKTYRLTQLPYKHMDYSMLTPGDYYQGDGHKCDLYIKKISTGKPYRPELTAFIDLSSRYVVGWWLTEDESSISTIYALSHTVSSQNHIPANVHTDNGSGFKLKLMNHDKTGFYKRVMNNTPRFSIPSNPFGKGIIERWFGTLKQQFHQLLPGFCGVERNLHPYQHIAINHILKNPSCALFLDCGLGKTAITLSALSILFSRFEIAKVFIVAPTQSCSERLEIGIFKMETLLVYPFCVAIGKPEKRQQALREQIDIYLVNYENLFWLTQQKTFVLMPLFLMN